MKSPTVTVAGRVSLETRSALEAKADLEQTTVSRLIARVLGNAARRWNTAAKENAK